MVVTSDAGEKSPSAASPVLHSRAGGEGQQQVQHQAPAVRLNHSDGPVKKEDSADVLLINSSSKRKHEDMGDAESDATDVESDDLDDEEELGEDDCDEDDAFDPSPRTGSSPIQSTASTTTTTTSITKTTKATTATTTPVSIKSRRPSRSCKPNSLIFNSDTTTLSPKRRRKIVRESLPPSPAADLIQSNQKSSGRKSTISSRSFARESVRKAVSALTGVNRPVKKLGRPRKYPIEVTGESVSSVKNGRIPVGRAVKGRKVGRGKKLTAKKGSPVGKCTPILTAILSGQSLAQTKTGRPKGRPRVLPSLDEVILNGAKSSPHTSATRSSPRRCDCEAKYKKILSNLEQSLEVRFAESTYKVCFRTTNSCELSFSSPIVLRELKSDAIFFLSHSYAKTWSTQRQRTAVCRTGLHLYSENWTT